MKLKPLVPEEALEGARTDFDVSTKIERWRVGAKALYQPAGLSTWTYLPYSQIRSAYPHEFKLSSGGCCGATVPTGGVVITYGEEGVLKLIPGNERYADFMIDALKERIPDLDTSVPEIYRKQSRDLM